MQPLNQIEFGNEKQASIKRGFNTKNGYPGFISCIDDTHTSIKKPEVSKHIFFNRNGCNNSKFIYRFVITISE